MRIWGLMLIVAAVWGVPGCGPRAEIVAQNRDFTFYGQVLDLATGQPVEGATVFASYNFYRYLGVQIGLDTKDMVLKTDEKGRFQFHGKAYDFGIDRMEKVGYYYLAPPRGKRNYQYLSESKPVFDPDRPVTFYLLKKTIPGFRYYEKGSAKSYLLVKDQAQSNILSLYDNFINRYAIRHESYRTDDIDKDNEKNYYKGDFSDLPEKRQTPLRMSLIADFKNAETAGQTPAFSKAEVWESEIKIDIQPGEGGWQITLKALNQESGLLLSDQPLGAAPEEGYQPEISFCLADKDFPSKEYYQIEGGVYVRSVYGVDLDRGRLDIKNVFVKDGGGLFPIYGRMWFYIMDEENQKKVDQKKVIEINKILFIEYGMNDTGYRFLGQDYDHSYTNAMGVMGQIYDKRIKGGGGGRGSSGRFGVHGLPEWVKLSDAELKKMVEEEVEKKYKEEGKNEKNDIYELPRLKQRAYRFKITERENLLARHYWSEEDERKLREESDKLVHQTLSEWMAKQEWLKDQIPPEFKVKGE